MQHHPRPAGRNAWRIAAACMATALAGPAALASAGDAAASPTVENVFWKELDRIEDTNDNGVLGDPGDTTYWNFYGGGPRPEAADQMTIDDPMIFGDDGFTIDSDHLRPDATVREDLDAARKVIQGDAMKELGVIPPLPKPSAHTVTGETGQETFDEASFDAATQAHLEAQEDHLQFVTDSINTSDVFQGNGFRWALVPQVFSNQAELYAVEGAQLPTYVARMQFEHVITAEDITQHDDGACSIQSTATSNYGWTQVGVALDSVTSEVVDDLVVDSGYAAVNTTATVDCLPEAASEQDLEATQDPEKTPEPTKAQDPQTNDDQETSQPPLVTTTPATPPAAEEVPHNPFDDPDRVEPISIDSGNTPTTPVWPLWTGAAMISLACITTVSYVVSRLRSKHMWGD